MPAVAAALVFACSESAARAQDRADPAETATFRRGPIALSPSVTISSGTDSNVLNTSVNPRSDVTFSLQPGVTMWMRFRALHVSLQNQTTLNRYVELSEQSGVNTMNGGRLELWLNRVTPYAGLRYLNTKERATLEVDDRARYRDVAVTAGVGINVSAKTIVDVSADRYSVAYDAGAAPSSDALREAFDRSGERYRVSVGYALTPLTTVSFVTETERASFDFSPERDSTTVKFGPAVDFKPFALLSGRAQVGMLVFRPDDPNVPRFSGSSAQVDLSYVLHGATRFTVSVQRGLNYSAGGSATYYLQTGFGLAVNHQFTEHWDAQARLGRARLDYQEPPSTGPVTRAPLGDDVISGYGGGMGYRFSKGTRLGLNVEYSERESTREGASYDGLRMFGSVTISFE